MTGSDDLIFEPANGRLKKYGLLPADGEFHAENITPDIDVVIVGMAMFLDNPELARAKELGLRVQTFPEFVYEHSKDKKRMVLAGSHGKTTTTAMVMHVLHTLGKPFDWLVGSLVEGFEAMVGLSEDAPAIIIEGDEYPESRETMRPKFLTYQHTVAVLNGIAWDHANVYPTFELYVDSFRQFLKQTPADGRVYYNADDPVVVKLVQEFDGALPLIPYTQHPYRIIDHVYNLVYNDTLIPVSVIGEHNMTNLAAAKAMCGELGVTDAEFYHAIASFQTTFNRLNLVYDTPTRKIYRDFAHSPSKLLATTKAVASLYADLPVIAVYELHTFSALSKDFLPQYHGHFDHAKEAIVFFSPEAVEHKKLPALSIAGVKEGFGNSELQVYDNEKNLEEAILAAMGKYEKCVLLLMSSGNFEGMDVKVFEG